MIQCGFCDFKNEDGKIVAKHWIKCKARLKLLIGMEYDCLRRDL